MSPSEVTTAEANGISVLLISADLGSGSDSGSANGTADGNQAVHDALVNANAPTGTMIVKDIESSADSNFLGAWFTAVKNAGYLPGFYLNPTHSDVNAAFCGAQSTPGFSSAIIDSYEPEPAGQSPQASAAPPLSNASHFSCGGGVYDIYQYVQARATGTNYDEDVAAVNTPGLLGGPASSHLVQTHTDGSVYSYTGSPCTGAGTGCSGWTALDGAGSNVTQVVTDSTGAVYALISNGAVFRSTGAACTAAGCSGWTELDGPGSGATQLAAGGGNLFILLANGAVFQSTGAACNPGCSGWTELDGPGSNMVGLAADTSGTLYGLVSNGAVFRGTGAPCNPGCSGWTELDGPGSGATQLAAGGGNLFILISNGAVFQSTGAACNPGCSGWTELDGPGSSTSQIQADDAGGLYILISNGAVFKSTGAACTSAGCSGWTEINGPGSSVTQLAAGGSNVYIRLTSGAVFQFTGPACNPGCSGWTQLDATTTTNSIAA